MALKVSALRKLGINLNKNPERIVDEVDALESLLIELSDTVLYKIWKRAPIDPSGEKMKMKVVEESLPKDEFVTAFKKEVDEFCDHVFRVRKQYAELRKLKENLSEHEVIMQMDFAENFTCRSLDEVQTAYWNQTSVTLHPIVVYYRERESLKHKSIVIISDTIHHSASTVCAFMDATIPEVRKIDPMVRKIHYWTDSPSSQYRNRFMFHTIASHEDKYGLKAQWNYFEAGHGKGPCDGLGGTTKRMADEAVCQGKSIIQDAHEFYRWAITSSMREVTFIFIEKETCVAKKEKLDGLRIKTVKNTMKLHAVVGVSLLKPQAAIVKDVCGVNTVMAGLILLLRQETKK